MKKSLLIIPLLALTSGLLASCGEKEDPVPPPPAHTHEYGSTWRCDAKNHWLECSCGNKKDIAAHIDADKNGKCDVCNYNVPLPHEHKYSDDWKSDETEHWHECSCGDKKDNAAHIDEDENGECDVCGHFVPVFDPNLKLGPASFVDENGKTHNRVTEIVDGGHYLFGYHRATSDKMRFVNAEPHKDDKGEYPYYLGTADESAPEDDFENVGEAAEIVIEFIGETNKFNMKFASETGRWNDKYLSVYCASSSYGNDVYSFYASDEVGAKRTAEPGTSGGGETCYYEFEMMDKYQVDEKHAYNINAPIISFADERHEEEEATPKFFGSGLDAKKGVGYISIDCANATKAMAEEYNLAFFYEA